MIKISVGITYEQSRPTGVASALIAQFGFLVKSALKMCCTKFFQTNCYKSQYATLGAKIFFDCPKGMASAQIAQFGFLVKSALKMCCKKLFFRQKLLQIKSRNFYVM